MVLTVTVFAAAMLSALVSLSAAYVFVLTETRLKRWTPSLVTVACGVLLGDAFFHLLPEALGSADRPDVILTWTLVGIVGFYTLEQALKTLHSHGDQSPSLSPTQRLPFMNLAGDALHNGTDGVLIATSFMADTTLGIATTIAVVLHEIPQEITDIAVLMRGGWSKSKAFISNFACALLTPLAAMLTLILGNSMKFNLALLLAITAGGFVYIALAKLMPLVVPVMGRSAPIAQFATMLIGVLSMQILVWIE